jgi:hypothetical protein
MPLYSYLPLFSYVCHYAHTLCHHAHKYVIMLLSVPLCSHVCLYAHTYVIMITYDIYAHIYAIMLICVPLCAYIGNYVNSLSMSLWSYVCHYAHLYADMLIHYACRHHEYKTRGRIEHLKLVTFCCDTFHVLTF